MLTAAPYVDSFSNPEVLVVIAKLQKAEIRLHHFSEPSNSGGALAPPISTPAIYAAAPDSITNSKVQINFHKF